MSIDSARSRRGFLTAVAAGATIAGAYAATINTIDLFDVGGDAGTITLIGSGDDAAVSQAGATDAWRAAIGTAVRISGEHGVVDGRIVSVADGMAGGIRPSTVRAEALIVYFETALPYAPDGDMIYRIETVVDAVGELFLTRGDDVFDKAILMAVLN